jgi:hypothetical protein
MCSNLSIFTFYGEYNIVIVLFIFNFKFHKVAKDFPSASICEPELDGLDDTVNFSFLFLRQFQETGECEITGLQPFSHGLS